MNEVAIAAVTVVLGSFVVVFGQIAQRFFIEPIQEQKRVVGEIAYAVVYYGNVAKISKAGMQQEAYEELRKLSGRLQATLWTVPQYRRFESMGVVERREDVLAAYTGLIGWPPP